MISSWRFFFVFTLSPHRQALGYANHVFSLNKYRKFLMYLHMFICILSFVIAFLNMMSYICWQKSLHFPTNYMIIELCVVLPKADTLTHSPTTIHMYIGLFSTICICIS